MNLEYFSKKIVELKYISSSLDFNKILEKFEIYFNVLIEENSKYNLTAITEHDEVYLKHFYDSILLLNYQNLDGLKVLDIGSGAGFPGIPLAICCPNTEFYLCEPTTKRAKFLEMVAQKLDLKNVTVLNKRAEELDKKYREYFDIVTSRAVSSLNILSELSIPFVKINSFFVPFKGSNVDEEIAVSKGAFKKLGMVLAKKEEYCLDENQCRTLLFFKKHCKTQLKFPRNYSLIKSKPL